MTKPSMLTNDHVMVREAFQAGLRHGTLNPDRPSIGLSHFKYYETLYTNGRITIEVHSLLGMAFNSGVEIGKRLRAAQISGGDDTSPESVTEFLEAAEMAGF